MWLYVYHLIRPEPASKGYLVLLCVPGQLLDVTAADYLLCLPCGGETALHSMAGGGEFDIQAAARWIFVS